MRRAATCDAKPEGRFSDGASLAVTRKEASLIRNRASEERILIVGIVLGVEYVSLVLQRMYLGQTGFEKNSKHTESKQKL